MHLPRLLGVQLAVAAAAAGLLIGPVSGSANNDPHRSYAAAGSFDLAPRFCGFPIHLDFPINNAYQTVTGLPDGSTVIKVTGRFVATVTNETTGRAVTLNASGPLTTTVAPDGITVSLNGGGLTLFYAANATQYGFPSNLVLTSGKFIGTVDALTNDITTLTRMPSVLMDVCAAVS
ncbi:MAG TPA: hypothetical protein VH661_06135 [Candidatus Dormibacteraeota bacterium]|jgi:hypothetical protein|nr:hypothetical protein [Candidatus Dormibacteraeota bacterium]